MSAITSRDWWVFQWEMLNSLFVSITLFAVKKKIDRRLLPGHCLEGSSCSLMSGRRSSRSWRNRSVPLPGAVRLCHSRPLFTAPQVCSLIWQGRAWRIVTIVAVFHRTNDSRLFPSARCQTLSCHRRVHSFLMNVLEEYPLWCWVVECVCVFVLWSACVQPRCSRFAHFMLTACPFVPAHADTCSTTEFKSWVPTRSGVCITWPGCKLVLFCFFVLFSFVVVLHCFSFYCRPVNGKDEAKQKLV